MCENCGCSGHHHDHAHDHNHAHNGEHAHVRPDGSIYYHTHDEKATREIALGQAILSANDRIAAENRNWFKERDLLVFNLISSPGAGKTTLLTQTLKKLQEHNISAAVIVGDQYGSLDAEVMRSTGVPVTQIETQSSCHLDAGRVQEVLAAAVPEGTRILFIENVGNLVCPVAFDLGENAKIALLSTPEGEEKPLKYPALFAAAELVLLTKSDLADILEWNYQMCVDNIKQVNADAQIMRIAAKNGKDLDHWIDFLLKKLQK